MSTGLIIVVIYFAISQILDCITTHIALKLGCEEWNPLVRWTGKWAPIYIGVIGAVVWAFAIYASIVAPVPNAIIAFWFLLFFGTLRIWASISNINKIRKIKQAK